MSNEKFKDYIEKRTVSEIMRDYSEQHDEWVTLKVVQNGKVVYPAKGEEPESKEQK